MRTIVAFLVYTGNADAVSKPMTRYAVPLLLVLVLSCARFKIHDLQPSVLLSLPMRSDTTEQRADQLLVSVKEGALYGLPARPSVFDNRIVLPLAEQNLVLEFSEGEAVPKRIYIPENAALSARYSDADIETIRMPAGQVGQVGVLEEATIIQLYPAETEERTEEIEPEHRMPAILFPEAMEQPGSEILAFLPEAQGPVKLMSGADTTFRQVWQILPGEDGWLYILHSPNGQHPVLNVYRQLQLHAVLSVPDSLFVAKDASVQLEALIPFRGKPEALASLVLRKKNSFEPIQRALYRLRPNTEPEEIFRYDTKEDVPIWTTEGGGFLLAHDEDGTGMLLKIFGPDAKYENNHRLQFEGLRESYQDTFFNGEDRLFSVRLMRGVYEIIEWK